MLVKKTISGQCRGCEASIAYGHIPDLDRQFDSILDETKVPKSLNIGAIIIPLGILGAVAFVNAL